MAEKFAQCHTMPSFAILFRKSTLNIWRISPVCLRRLRPMPCSLALWCALGQVTGRIIASSLFLSLQPSEWSLQCTKVAHRFKGYLGCTKMHSLMHLVKKWKFIIVCCGKFMDLYSHIRYTFLELQSESEPCKFFHVFGKGVLASHERWKGMRHPGWCSMQPCLEELRPSGAVYKSYLDVSSIYSRCWNVGGMFYLIVWSLSCGAGYVNSRWRCPRVWGAIAAIRRIQEVSYSYPSILGETHGDPMRFGQWPPPWHIDLRGSTW